MRAVPPVRLRQEFVVTAEVTAHAHAAAHPAARFGPRLRIVVRVVCRTREREEERDEECSSHAPTLPQPHAKGLWRYRCIRERHVTKSNAGDLLRPRQPDERDRRQRLQPRLARDRRSAAEAEGDPLRLRDWFPAAKARHADEEAANDSHLRRLSASAL